MSDLDRQRMDVISEALARLVRRQGQTDERLARIERALGLPALEAAPAEPEPMPPSIPPAISPEPSPATAPEPAAPHGIETSVGLTWLNRIGVITLVFGVAFFFKYAVDNQWIGETERVALGVLAGLCALGLADRFWRAGHAVYAQGICGGGLATLYLSFFAAFSFYRLIEGGAAFLLMAAVTAAAGGLALRYSAGAIAGIGLLGGYLTPLLLSTGEDRAWFLFCYVLLLTVAALAVVRLRGWRWLEVLAFAGTAVVYLAWFNDQYTPEKRFVATTFPLVFYCVFASRDRRALVVGAQLLTGLALLPIWPPPRLAYLGLSLAVAAAGMIVADRRNWPGLPFTVFALYWLLYGAWHLDLREPYPLSSVFGLVTMAFLLFLAWMPWRVVQSEAPAGKEDLALTAINAAAYFGFCYSLLESAAVDFSGALAISLAAVHAAFALWLRNRAHQQAALLFAGIAACFVTLAIPIHFSAYRITIAWSLEAAALAWIAARTGEKRLFYASLAIFAGVLLRLMLVDSSMYAAPDAYRTAFNARFLAFATAALSLWGTAWWSRLSRLSLAAYLAGHFVMVWALILETVGWCGRSVAPENLPSVETAAISILLAAYAALLVAGGALMGSALNRIVGLGLIGIVVLKLYFYDVWLLDRVYRIWAFAVLGILILAVSFIYSRYRSSLESWWKQGKTKGDSE